MEPSSGACDHVTKLSTSVSEFKSQSPEKPKKFSDFRPKKNKIVNRNDGKENQNLNLFHELSSNLTPSHNYRIIFSTNQVRGDF